MRKRAGEAELGGGVLWRGGGKRRPNKPPTVDGRNPAPL